MAGNKKKLLSESQVRQFMKLANLEPLSPGFVHGLSESAPVDEGFLDNIKQAGKKVGKKMVDYAAGGQEATGMGHGGKHSGGTQLGAMHGQKMKDQDTLSQARAQKFIGGDAPADLEGAVTRRGQGWKGKGKTHRAASEMEESHGRGQDEGSAGYGHPDPRQRPAGSRLREQDEELEMDVELDDLDGDIELDDEFEVEDDLDVEGPPEGGREVSVDDFLSALEIALEDVLGEEVEVSEDEEEELEAEDLEGEEVDLDLEDEELELQERAPYGGNKGDIPAKDRKKKGHHGRGPKRKETAKEEGEGDYGKLAEGDVVERLAHVVAARLMEKRQGADDREDEHLGAEDGKEADKKQSFKDRRKEMRGARRAKGESGDPVPTQEALDVDALVEKITKSVTRKMVQEKLNSKKTK